MSKIAYHHIGARGGSYPLPIRAPNPHLADFQFIFFDADPDCAEQVRAQLPDVAANTKVVPIAIGAEDGPADLFITFDPYGSSLYRVNERYASYNAIHSGGRGTLGEILKAVATQRVDVRRLDSVCAEAKIAPPDMLSLDVQGAEWDVLAGARTLVETSVLGIDLEVEFAEIYRGQKVFSQIHDLLIGLGFELFRVTPGDPSATMVMPIGFFGEERQTWGEALYLKSIDHLTATAGPETTIRLYKLGLLALLYDQVSYAVRCLEAIEARRAANPDPWGSAGAPGYAAFLDGFFQLYQSWPKVTVPDFSETHTLTMSQSRFWPEDKRAAAMKGDLGKEIDATRARLSAAHGKNAGYILKLLLMSRTPIETYLADNGFARLAQIVTEKRKAQAETYLRVLM